MATTNEINIEEYRDMSPRNWIPKGRHKPLSANGNSEKSNIRYEFNHKEDDLSDERSEKSEKLLNQTTTNEESPTPGNKNNNHSNAENINSTQTENE